MLTKLPFQLDYWSPVLFLPQPQPYEPTFVLL